MAARREREDGDAYLDRDGVFGVKESLIRPYVRCEPGTAPDGRMMDRPYVHLNYDVSLKPAVRAR